MNENQHKQAFWKEEGARRDGCVSCGAEVKGQRSACWRYGSPVEGNDGGGAPRSIGRSLRIALLLLMIALIGSLLLLLRGDTEIAVVVFFADIVSLLSAGFIIWCR